MKQIVCAGIVSYNPDLERLKENIEAIESQVERVIVFDNGSTNQKTIIDLVKKYNNTEMITSEKNGGIAAALNGIMRRGYKEGYQWMLSLDQDSVCSVDFVEKMFPFLTVEDKIGIVAPVIVDRNIGVVGHNPSTEYAHVNTCITSGAIVNIEEWEKIGKYDESMFIDSVDFEFCYRMRKNGYGVIQVSSVQLLHELGNSQKRRFLLWKVDINGHSAFRKYYIARNNVYYPLKHNLWLHFIRGNFRNLWLLISVSLYEDCKGEKNKAIVNGWKEGYRVRR